jgi:hypothetical protein
VGQHQTGVGLELQSYPVAGRGRARQAGATHQRRKEGREEERAARGEWAKEAAGLRARGERGKKGRVAGPCGREKEGRLGWAAREKERGKRKRGVGRAQLENEREKEMHSNAFEFEFEI